MASVTGFGVRVSLMFHLMFVYYTFGSVWVAIFWEIAARSVGHMFSLSFVYLYLLFISNFSFHSRVWLMIAPVPVHCFSITFRMLRKKRYFIMW